MESSITREMVLQNTICGEIKGSTKDGDFPEIAKKVLWASNKDKELDKEQSNEGITEIDQTGKNVDKAREAYFNFVQSQKRQKMACTKRTVKEKW